MLQSTLLNIRFYFSAAQVPPPQHPRRVPSKEASQHLPQAAGGAQTGPGGLPAVYSQERGAHARGAVGLLGVEPGGLEVSSVWSMTNPRRDTQLIRVSNFITRLFTMFGEIF